MLWKWWTENNITILFESLNEITTLIRYYYYIKIIEAIWPQPQDENVLDCELYNVKMDDCRAEEIEIELDNGANELLAFERCDGINCEDK